MREIAYEWSKKFGATDGLEEKAYLAGVRASLEFAMSLCLSSSTPSMIRLALYNKISEIDGRERA